MQALGGASAAKVRNPPKVSLGHVRFGLGAVIASRGDNDRNVRTPARDAGYGEGRFVAKCLLLRGVVECG